MNYFGSIFAIVVCIAMSAYFSATETAFSSLNKTRLKVLRTMETSGQRWRSSCPKIMTS